MRRQESGKMMAQNRAGSGQAQALPAFAAELGRNFVELRKEGLDKAKELVARFR